MRILVLDLHIAKHPNAALLIVNAVRPYCTGNLELMRLYARDFDSQALFTYHGIILSGLDRSRLLYSGKMQRLKSWIRRLDSNTQVLGICGGHQVLATAYGYPVHEITPEVGWHDVRITEVGQQDPLFHGLGSTIRPFHHHNKAVFHVSPEKILAVNAQCIQAVQYQPNIRGIQFHPEYKGHDVDALPNFPRDNSDLLERHQSRFARDQAQFFQNFAALLES